MGIGLLFPGQASQFPGMGKELHEAYPVAREVFDEASDALGFSLADLCFRGSAEDLRMTENTQPSIFAVSVAAYRVLAEETGIRPLCAAGHSLGEYSALVASGALSLSDAVRLLRSRGRFMQEAVPSGEGAMAAVIGLSPEVVGDICRDAGREGVVEPANFNGGDQIVISGSARAVAAACEAAKSAGAKKVMPLPVSAPFHCALMEPAAERLAPALRAAIPGKFSFPVVANVTADTYPHGDRGGGDPHPADRLPRAVGGVRPADAGHGSDIVPGIGAREGSHRTAAQDRERCADGGVLLACGPAGRPQSGRVKFFLVRSLNLWV